ncbi:MAG: type II secretion system F family protein [Propionicimonas sp.]|nr:type II secretion system F family protein [Propionicimonas sp.]
MTGLAPSVVFGVLIAGGLLAAVVGWTSQPSEPGAGTPPRRRVVALVRRFGPRRLAATAAWALAGVVAAALTGWVLLAVLGPVLGLGVPYLLGKPDDREVRLLEALDRWVRSLAAILPTGRSIGDAIRISVRQAPELLAGHLGLLVQRLDDRWTVQQALYAMADELDSADVDAVVAALALSAERGGTGAQASLGALADAIQERLRATREIETERAKPRIVVRQVTVITLVVLGGALVLGGGFFEPYRTPTGQFILSVLIAAYLGSLLMLRRLAQPRPRQRILRRVT